MSDTKIFSIPDANGGGSGSSLANGIVPFMLGAGMSGGMGGFGFGGLGGWGGITELFAMGILAQMFGWNNGGMGGMNGGAAAGFLANQLNNDSGREMLMNAITNQGERQHEAVQTLSTMLGQDFNLVNNSIQTIQMGLNQLAVQQGMTPLQIINSIQSGNASLSHQLCECCCNMQRQVSEQGYQAQLRTVEQTNALQQTANAGFNGVQTGISGIQTQMAINQGRDDLNVCQQTYTLRDGQNTSTQAILSKLAEMQTQSLQDKLEAERDKNTALAGEISQRDQNQYFAGLMSQGLAPINGALAALNKEVDDLKCKLPNTVSVPYPNLQVVNATPYVSGGIYPNGMFNGYGGYGNWGGGF